MFHCKVCGDKLDVIVVQTMGGKVMRFPEICLKPECQPPPSPEELRRLADDWWLHQQRQLANG